MANRLSSWHPVSQWELNSYEYYNLYSATFFEGIKAPDASATDLPSTREILARIRTIDKKLKTK